VPWVQNLEGSLLRGQYSQGEASILNTKKSQGSGARGPKERAEHWRGVRKGPGFRLAAKGAQCFGIVVVVGLRLVSAVGSS